MVPERLRHATPTATVVDSPVLRYWRPTRFPPGMAARWTADNAPGVDVIISHPQPVRTGLTLFDAMGSHNFPSLLFYETGFEPFTLRQASRRLWRIGQRHPCRVYLCISESAWTLHAERRRNPLALSRAGHHHGCRLPCPVPRPPEVPMSRTKLEILAVFIVVVGLSPERLYSETRTAADLTPEAVGKAINTAQDGDTVQLPAGTAIWSKKAWNSGHSPKVKAVTIQAGHDAAGEVCDLDRRLAVDLALHVPIQHLRLGVGEGRIEHGQLLAAGEEPQFDRRGVDQRIGPTELQRVAPGLKGTLRVSRTSVRSSEL